MKSEVPFSVTKRHGGWDCWVEQTSEVLRCCTYACCSLLPLDRLVTDQSVLNWLAATWRRMSRVHEAILLTSSMCTCCHQSIHSHCMPILLAVHVHHLPLVLPPASSRQSRLPRVALVTKRRELPMRHSHLFHPGRPR